MILPKLPHLVPLIAIPAALIPAAESRTCKAVPGSSNWPSQDSWHSLNSSVGGALLAPLPPAIVCDHTRPRIYNQASCAAVGTEWQNASFHYQDPVSLDWPNWQNDSCLPTAIFSKNTQCNTSPFPHYVVNATNEKQVAAAVKFAAKTGVRLSVKGTGHDFLGRSTSPGLSIWTAYIRGITTNSSFVPHSCKRCSAAPAMTISAGHRMHDIYAVAARRDLLVVGGADASVGLGGYLTGGGHSALSGKYGLAVDQVLEMKVVTPSGDILLANEAQNADLFWAMKGGGGATFGILLSATVKTYPKSPVTFFAFNFNSTQEEASKNNNSNFYSSLAAFHTQLPALSEAGLVGYYSISPIQAATNSYVPNQASSDGRGPMVFSFMGGALDAAAAAAVNQVFNPFYAKINSTAGVINSVLSYPDVDIYTLFGTGTQNVGTNNRIGSRLWDKKALEDQQSIEKVLRVFENSWIQGLFVSGPGVRSVPVNASSVNPAWRSTYVHLVTAVSYGFKNATVQAEEANYLTNTLTKALRDHAPNMGCYLNEADVNEPNYQQAFWGAHYPRLLKIKHSLDPKGVFWCKTCVGGEDWKLNVQTGELCHA